MENNETQINKTEYTRLLNIEFNTILSKIKVGNSENLDETTIKLTNLLEIQNKKCIIFNSYLKEDN